MTLDPCTNFPQGLVPSPNSPLLTRITQCAVHCSFLTIIRMFKLYPQCDCIWGEHNKIKMEFVPT